MYKFNKSKITIGRTGCDINIKYSFVSKNHATVECFNDEWIYRDGIGDKPSIHGAW